MPYQYGNEANPGAHYHGTAVEILDELDGSPRSSPGSAPAAR